jgi:hypothetical protein
MTEHVIGNIIEHKSENKQNKNQINLTSKPKKYIKNNNKLV